MAKEALLVLTNLTGKVRTFTHASGNRDARIDAWPFARIVCEIRDSEFNIL